MAGLDTIKHFETGGTTGSTDSTVGYAKPATVKIGGAELPHLTGAVPVDESILENMRRLVAEKEAQKGSFLENLKDAAAWTAGGTQGPTQALVMRGQEREKTANELFAIQNQLAQYKAIQEQNQNLSKFYNSPVGGAANAPSGVPGQPGATPAVSGASRVDTIISRMPTDVQQQLLQAAGKIPGIAADWNQFNAIVREQVKNRPDLQKNYEFMQSLAPKERDLFGRQAFEKSYQPQVAIGASGEKYEFSTPGTVPEGVLPSGESTNVPTATASTNTGAAAAKSAGVPVISGTRSTDEQWKLYEDWIARGKTGNPVARPGTSKHETGNALDVDMKKASPEHIDWLKQNGYVQPLPTKDPNHWEKVGTPTTTGATSPVQRKSTQDIALEKKVAETELTGRATDINKQRAEITNAGDISMPTLESIGRIESVINTEPGRKAAGVLQQPTMAAALAGLVQKGITVGQIGNVGLGGLEDAVRKAGYSGEEGRAVLDAAQKLTREFAEMQLNVAKRNLKGQGAVSDNERLIVAHVTGDIHNSPKVIEDFMRWNRARTEYDRDVNDAMVRWEAANPNKSHALFRISPEYTSLKQAYIKKTDDMVKTMDTSKTIVPHAAQSLVEKYKTKKKD